MLIIDWPGQGRSGHFGSHWLTVHCSDFNDHLRALDLLIGKTRLEGEDLVLFGHSMGGHLALRYSNWRFDRVKCVILSAPMMLPPVTPVMFVRCLGVLLSWLGFDKRLPPFSTSPSLEFGVRRHYPDNVLTRCKSGYENQFLWFDDFPKLRRVEQTVG